jgi:hypothetical protein
MSMDYEMKNLIILVLGSRIDLNFYRRGSKRAKEKRRTKEQAVPDAGLHCNFSLSHGSILHLSCCENVEASRFCGSRNDILIGYNSSTLLGKGSLWVKPSYLSHTHLNPN